MPIRFSPLPGAELEAQPLAKILNTEPHLAVLAACNTGRGKITGDGVVGLSRSLLSLGVSTVIVSLWEVPDQSTTALMTSFYTHLCTQPDKAQALRAAMLEGIKTSRSPNSWAEFILIGSPG
jgi:CHAT domain-containing protein